MDKKLRILLTGLALGLALVAPSQAATTAKLEVTKPLGAGTVKLTFTANGVTQTVTAEIKATDSAEDKAKKIADALKAKGYTNSTAGTTITIPSLPNATTVTFDPGKTGEGKDQLTVEGPAPAGGVSSGKIGFAELYSTIGGDGDPAVFTAGVVEGFNEVTVSYQADPDGGVIAGASVAAELFASLSAAIDAAGFEISVSLDGREILVDFGEGMESERGVTFGTTVTRASVAGNVR